MLVGNLFICLCMGRLSPKKDYLVNLCIVLEKNRSLMVNTMSVMSTFLVEQSQLLSC